VEQFILHFLASASGLPAYGLVFGVLVACGLGFPLPEDVSLIMGGFLVYKGHASLPIMLIVGFAGILAGDSVVYGLGHWYRARKGKHPGGLLGRHLTPQRIQKVERSFHERGPIMVMIARFLPGVRAATYFVAGGANMEYGKFIAYDAIAALLSAPLFVLAGRHFGTQIAEVVAWAEEFHTLLIVGMVIAAVALVVRSIVLRRRAPEPVRLHVVRDDDERAAS
jgi:membrane protein DedA with SNARE-associated domain